MLCVRVSCAPVAVLAAALADLFDSLTLREAADVQTARTGNGRGSGTEKSEATGAEQPVGQPRHSVSGVRTGLFSHQAAGLQWMARRETGQTAEGTSPLGGIVADQPGLGKTLMMLALVAQSKKQHQQATKQQQHAALSGERSHSSKSTVSVQSIAVEPLPSRCTLVVCPRAVLRQWQRESSEHLEAGLLSVDCLLSGASRAVLTAADIARRDVVITSYESVRSQHQQLLALQRQTAARSPQPSTAELLEAASAPPLFAVSYLRLIADEAHRLRNRKAQLTAAVCALSATHRWYVTATPLQNSIDDLYPAFLFLHYAPYSDYTVWKQYMHSKDGKGVERCRTLMRAIAIRRIKAQQPQQSPQQQQRVNDDRENGSSVPSGVEMTAKHVQLVELTFEKQSNSQSTQLTSLPSVAVTSLLIARWLVSCGPSAIAVLPLLCSQGETVLRRAVVGLSGGSAKYESRQSYQSWASHAVSAAHYAAQTETVLRSLHTHSAWQTNGQQTAAYGY